MIYDCFTFFNELDLLELRLNELDSVVDKFVLVEATHTFTGKKKPLYFKNNRQRFSKFKDKIIHVEVHDLLKAPKASTLAYIDIDRFGKHLSVWEREFYQRNYILKGLSGCKSDDLILICDVDEIPKPSVLNKLKMLNSKTVAALEFNVFYHYINCISEETITASRAVKYSNIKDPQEIRLTEKCRIIKNAGWHFTYFSEADNVSKKIKSFSHQEYNSKKYTEQRRLAFNLEHGLDPYGRTIKYHFVKIDSSFPRYIRENKSKFKKYIKDLKSAGKWQKYVDEIYFAREKAHRYEMENMSLKENLALREHELQSIYNSKSWKAISHYRNSIKPLFSARKN